MPDADPPRISQESVKDLPTISCENADRCFVSDWAALSDPSSSFAVEGREAALRHYRTDQEFLRWVSWRPHVRIEMT
jgi:hypothetical protein